MSRTLYKVQKEARRTLGKLFANSANSLVIHYSCESFYDRPQGASPRVTSIAVRNLETAQTNSFSIHQIAERHGHDLQNLDDSYDKFEHEMLDGFFKFVDRHQNFQWLHWNMRDINYGFQALEHRFTVLKGTPIEVLDTNKIDLARLLIDLYGVGYIGHPRLEKLVEKNDITRLAFMNGAQEADAFVTRNYVGLHQSTLRKVDIMANIAGRAYSGDLKTNASWWEMHGGSIKGAVTWLAENPWFIVLAGVAGIIVLVVAFK